MKKLLIILMVIAMVSFLYAGCTLTTPAEEEEEEEETEAEEELVPTDTPTISSISGIDITSDSTQYVNSSEAENGITVEGSAATSAEVKVYINDAAVAATADVTATGTWSLIITESELGDDGEKTVYAIASEVGLADATSTSYKFTLDTVAPKISEVKATANALAGATAATVKETGTAVGIKATVETITPVTPANVVAGTWTIDILGISGALNNVKITSSGGYENVFTKVGDLQTFGEGSPIPGVAFTLVAGLTAGQKSEIVCTGKVAEIKGRATLKFTGDVSSIGEALAVYKIEDLTVVADITAAMNEVSYKESNDTNYWDSTTRPALGDTLQFTVSKVTDAAGNAMPVTTATCVVTTASATGALVP